MKFNKATLKKKFTTFAEDIDKHEVFLVAGSIAYTTALALAPFMLILLSIASLLGPELQAKIFTEISHAMGHQAGATVLEIVKNAHDRPAVSGISGVIGFIILTISASAIFTQLKIALDKINEYEAPKSASGFMSFVKDKFLSFGLVFGFIFLSIVSLMLSTLIAALYPGGEGFIWEAVSFVVSFLMFATLFSCIYRFIPSGTMDWKRCRVSGVVSAVFYLIGKSLIGMYLGKAGVESSYGAAGSLVVFLAWVYYTALTLLISYEFSTNLVLDDGPNTLVQK